MRNPPVIADADAPWPHVRDLRLATAFGPVPASHLFHQDAVPRPLVVFANGINAVRQQAVPPGVAANRISPPLVAALLNAGYDVLVPENPGHGEREDPGRTMVEMVSDGLAGTGPDLLALAEDEIASLLDDAVRQGVVADARSTAVVGHSWGGLQSLLRFLGDPRIASAVLLIPVVEPTCLEQFAHLAGVGDRAEALTALARRATLGRPLRIITGADDVVAPAALAERFAKEVGETYRTAPEQLSYVELADVGHDFDPRQVDLTLSWLKASLPPV